MTLLLSPKKLIKSKSSNDFLRRYNNPFAKSENEFIKIKNDIIPNTKGTPPEILYYKESKDHSHSLYKINYINSKGFISDGGLNKKYNKYALKRNGINSKQSILSNDNSSKTLIKDVFSKSMKNIRKINNKNLLYESKNNSLKKYKYYTSSSRSLKNIFSFKNKINKNDKKENKKTGKKKEKEKKKNINKKEKNEEEKYEKMNQLIEDKIASYIRDLQNKKKLTLEEERNEKKQKILLENGIEIRIDSTNDDEEIKENNFENEKIEEEKLSADNLSSNNLIKSKRAISPKINNFFFQENQRKIFKPRINSFEYINILKNLEGSIKENKIVKSNSTTKINNNPLNNSFRLSNSISNKNKKNDNILFSKKNKRKKEELKEFIEKKNEIRRKKIEDEEKAKNNKDLINFRNLCNLYFYYLNKNNNNNKKVKRKKVKIKNEYYIGTDSKSYSTIIDSNEYFLAVLESQQLLVNGGLFKINNLDYKNNNLNISKSQIKKITEKESKKNLNESSERKINEIKEKINRSLIKREDIINKIDESQNKNIENDLLKIEKKNELKKEKQEELYFKKDLEEKKLFLIKEEDLKKKINKENKLLIETNNNSENETNSNLTSKEENLPSLSHTYISDINNEKIIIGIEPRLILNLVEIIKLLIQRKIFYKLYEIYVNEAISQRYSIAFAFFVAICKQYSFRKIEEFYNYKTYYYAFLQLFKPFIKRNFRFFINCCFTKKKIEYFVELLSRMFKFKAMEKIYIYCQIIDGDEEAAFKLIITKIMKTIMKPKLREAFNNFITNLRLPDKEKNNIRNNNDNKNINLNNINSNIINTPKILNEVKNSEKNSPFFSNEKTNISKKPEHFIKMNSYIYESLESSKSSFTVEPNSVDNEKLHKLHMMLFEKREQIIKNNNNYLNYYENNNNTPSHKSSVSVQEISKMKPRLSLNRTLSNLSNENLNDSIKKSIESNKSLQRSISNKSLKDLKKNSGNVSKDSINDNNININHCKDNNIDKEVEIIKENLKPNNEENKNIIDNKKINNKIPFIFEKEDKQLNIKNEKENFQNEELKDEKIKSNNEKKISEKEQNEIINHNINQLSENNNNSNSNNKNNSLNFPERTDNKVKIFSHHSNSEIDISAEKDINNPNIDWEYSIPIKSESDLIKKDNEIKKNNDNLNNDINNNILISNKKNYNHKEQNEKLFDDLNFEDREKKNNNNKELNDNKKEEEKKEIKIIEENKNQIEENKKINNKENNSKNLSDKEEDYTGDFENISDIEKEDEQKNNNQNIISIIKNEMKQNDKSRNNLINQKGQNKEINQSLNNNNLNQTEKSINNNNNINEEIKIKNEKEEKNKNPNENFKQLNIENLTDEIILNLLNSEIKYGTNLFPKRKYKYDPFNGIDLNISKSGSLVNTNNFFKETLPLNKDINLKEKDLNTSITSLSSLKDNNNFQLLNDSLMSSYSANSFFNKTMKDIKKEYSLKFYINKIAPKLIKLIKEKIKEKYNEIYDNLSTPLINHTNNLMVSLASQDAEMLRENYKKLNVKEEISNILNGEKLLSDFDKILKKIIEKENIKNEENYIKNLNKCIIDTTIELLNKERLYGELGEPLPWSNRTHKITFKYEKNDCKKLCDFITNNLFSLLYNKIGLITENYDFLTNEQLNNERERRVIEFIKKELNENENQWKNLEMEETQLKIEVSEMIMDQLYNEVIEILEHVQYSRKKPDLYQNKSIYACEEIPKLSFQISFSGIMEEDENNLINI